MSQRGLIKQIKQDPIFFEGDQFSEVTEQKTSEVERAEKEEEQEDLGWRTFHKEKIQLQKLKKLLFSEYVQYRNNLTQAIRQYCSETNNRSFDFTSLTENQQLLLKKNQEVQNLKEQKEDEVEEKIVMVEKMLSQRRIKRYYKNKYQVNVQDQLDPEDDQKQIYQYYEEIFGGNLGQQSPSSILAPQHHQLKTHVYPPVHTAEYSIMSSSIAQPQTVYGTEKVSPHLETSINRAHFQTDPSRSAKSDHKIQDPFMAGLELSFDPRNENHFPSNKIQDIDSFGLHENEHNDVMSEGGYFKPKPPKEEDQMSHKDNIYKNFIDKQNEQLALQRMKVQQLTAKAMKVLNNDEVDDDQLHGDEEHEHQHDAGDKFAQFKYFFGSMVEIFCVAQCLKFMLKFKSFELINKLYENASSFYEEEIVFEEPLMVKHMSQIVAAALPEQSQQSIRVVIQNIFDKESEINYEQFIEKLTPFINDHEFKILEESLVDTSTNSVFDLTVGLFGLWIEYDHFQKNLKDQLRQYPIITERFLSSVSEEGAIITPFVTDFLGKNKKSKSRKLKVEIFLRKILGDHLKNSQFYRWIETRKMAVNQSFQKMKETEKYEYFYNLY